VQTLKIWERPKVYAVDGTRGVGVRRFGLVICLDIGAEWEFTMFIEIGDLPVRITWGLRYGATSPFVGK
jgi:hypothetical protein